MKVGSQDHKSSNKPRMYPTIDKKLVLFFTFSVIQSSGGEIVVEELRHANKSLRLHCPTGKTFPAVEGEAMRGYEDHCQCQDGALCWFHTDHVDLGCSGGLLGAYAESQVNAKVTTFTIPT